MQTRKCQVAKYTDNQAFYILNLVFIILHDQKPRFIRIKDPFLFLARCLHYLHQEHKIRS